MAIQAKVRDPWPRLSPSVQVGVGGDGPVAQASGDPRRPQEAKRYVRPATKEEPELDVMLLVAMGFGLASLFLKVPRSFSPAFVQHS